MQFVSFEHSEIVRLTMLITNVLIAAAAEASGVVDILTNRRQYAVNAFFDAQWCVASAVKGTPVVTTKKVKSNNALLQANSRLLTGVDVAIQSTYANTTYSELAKDSGNVVEIVARSDGVARHSVMNGFKFTMGSEIAKSDRVWPPYDFGCRCRAKQSSGLPSTVVPDGGRRPGFSGGPNNPRDGHEIVVAQLGPNFNYRTRLVNINGNVIDLRSYRATPDELAAARRAFDTQSMDNYFNANDVTSVDRRHHPELSDIEIASILDYTYVGCYDMNQELRQHGGASNSALRAKITASALNKMPKVKGDVYRGTDVPDTVKYEVGQTWADCGFTSASSDKKLARHFAHIGRASSGNRSVIYTIKSTNGVSVKNISVFPDENEVVFTAGSGFRVTSVETKTEKTWLGRPVKVEYVALEEL